MEKVKLRHAELSVHPRGFVGTEFCPGKKPLDYLQLRQSQSTSHPILNPAIFELITGDEEIGVIKRRFMMAPTNRPSIDLLDSLFAFAIKKIATPIFTDWIQAQVVSPATANIHMEFLDDTLRYIMGSQRTMSFSSYRLAIAASSKKVNGISLKEFSSAFVKANQGKSPDGTEGFATTAEVLQLWMSRDNGNGILDLLYTLDLMYGPIDQ